MARTRSINISALGAMLAVSAMRAMGLLGGTPFNDIPSRGQDAVVRMAEASGAQVTATAPVKAPAAPVTMDREKWLRIRSTNRSGRGSSKNRRPGERAHRKWRLAGKKKAA